MRSRSAGEIFGRRVHEVVGRYRGELTGVVRMGAGRTVAQSVPEPSAVPVLADESELQDADGAFHALFEYSAFDGGDIFAP